MAAKQKSQDFRIEDWAISEDELPWNTPAAAKSRAPNVIELDQYRRQKRNKSMRHIIFGPRFIGVSKLRVPYWEQTRY
jgi:hypothetical protein